MNTERVLAPVVRRRTAIVAGTNMRKKVWTLGPPRRGVDQVLEDLVDLGREALDLAMTQKCNAVILTVSNQVVVKPGHPSFTAYEGYSQRYGPFKWFHHVPTIIASRDTLPHFVTLRESRTREVFFKRPWVVLFIIVSLS